MPQVSQGSATPNLTRAQLAWNRFVEKVERGEQIDPTGQYVSKGTQAPVDKDGKRINRPKYDAAKGTFPRGLMIRASGTVVLPADLKSKPNALLTGVPQASSIDDPIVICEQCPGEGGGPQLPPSATIFISSETTSTYTDPNNPNGYIYDLKIVKGDQLEQPLLGYNKINVDLNRGAGGEYIYLTFTRRTNYVQLGDETGWGWNPSEISGPIVNIQAFENPSGISLGWIVGLHPLQGYVPVWAPNPVPGSDWKHPDLNDGAGGAWVYAYQFKDPRFGNGRPVEVGVISSNTSNPVPPAGWTADYLQDLNEGAGGDYIYFCTKNK